MPNCPEYMAIWLGITRIGATVSLVNTNLMGESLSHSINIVAPKHVIAGAELADTLAAAGQQLDPDAKCWVHGESSHRFRRIDEEIQRCPRDSLHSSERQPPSIMDLALYIYIRLAQLDYPRRIKSVIFG
jgi:fatty-acyl-CoA synthase